MSATILRVSHPSLGEDLTFTQDELPQMKIRWEQAEVLRQMSQTGNVTYNYIGQERALVDLVFEIFKHGSEGTLEKLDQIRRIQEPFTIWPMLLRYAGTSFSVWWGAGPLIEEWIVGYPRAQFDFPITWEEATTGTCPQILLS